MVKIFVDSQPYDLFMQVDITRSLDNWAGGGQIAVSEAYNKSPDIKINSLIEIQLDNQFKVLTGYCESYDDHINPNTHDIGYKIRDNVQDIIDSTVPASFITGLPAEGKLYIKYSDLIKDIIKGLGLNTIYVYDEKELKFPGTGAIVTAQYGQKAGDFLMDYGRLCNAILSTEGQGNVIIFPLNTKLKTCLINQKDGNSNNVKDAHLKIDYSGLYYKYIFHSTAEILSNGPDMWGHPGSSGFQNSVGEAIDSEIRPTRIYEVLQEKLGGNEACKARAQEEMNLRRGRSINYECTVQGFSANGQLWDIGNLVEVWDDDRIVFGLMLIKEVTWHQGNDGETTKMILCSPQAYGISVSYDNGQLTLTDNYTKAVTPTLSLKKPQKSKSSEIKQTSGGKH